MDYKKEYRKLRKNLQNRIRRAEKTGYNVNINLGEFKDTYQQVQHLKKLTREFDKKLSIQSETGKTLKGKKAREYVRQQAQTGYFDVISWLLEGIDNLQNQRVFAEKYHGRSYSKGRFRTTTINLVPVKFNLKNYIYDGLTEMGERAYVLRVINPNKEEIAELLQTINEDSSSEKVKAAIGRLPAILKYGGTPTQEEMLEIEESIYE